MSTAAATVWLITGANRGIGLELARQLLQQPSNIIIGAVRDPAKAAALHALGKEGKGTLHVVGLDATDRESVRKAASDVAGILGPDGGIDYLVNNAGIFVEDTAYTIDIDVLEKILRTNVSGPAYVSQVFLPFVEKSTKKTILNISSSIGSKSWKDGGPINASYSISKSALNMLTVKQARERPDITAVAICPGWLKTDMGGEGALFPVSVGVSGVLKVVSGLTPANSGEFINHQGEQVPW